MKIKVWETIILKGQSTKNNIWNKEFKIFERYK